MVPPRIAPRRGRKKTRTRLDCVNGRIGERAHRAGDESNQHVLVRRQLGRVGLQPLRELLELLVRGEVRALVRRLPQRGERDAAVERGGALLAHDCVHGVSCVAVARRLERVRERVAVVPAAGS